MFKKIDHVAFFVKNRVKSIEFYERNFGFQKYFEHNVPVPAIEKIVYLKLSDTVLELIHIPEGQMQNSGYHFCITTDDFDGDYHKLKNAGVSVDTEPHPTDPRVPAEQGWRRAVFIGLDGELIEIRG